MNQITKLSTHLDFEALCIVLKEGDEEITRSGSYSSLGRAIHEESILHRRLRDAECACGLGATRLLDVDFDSRHVVGFCEDCYAESLEESWAELSMDR